MCDLNLRFLTLRVSSDALQCFDETVGALEWRCPQMGSLEQARQAELAFDRRVKSATERAKPSAI